MTSAVAFAVVVGSSSAAASMDALLLLLLFSAASVFLLSLLLLLAALVGSSDAMMVKLFCVGIGDGVNSDAMVFFKRVCCCFSKFGMKARWIGDLQPFYEANIPECT